MNHIYSLLPRLKTGDRVVVPKSGFGVVQHHGLFLGSWSGRYWFIENSIGAGVQLVTAEAFFAGVASITKVERFNPKPGYSRNDLYRFAISKVGKRYDLLNYNCESFCNEIQHFRVKSKQVDDSLLFGAVAGLFLLFGAALTPQRS